MSPLKGVKGVEHLKLQDCSKIFMPPLLRSSREAWLQNFGKHNTEKAIDGRIFIHSEISLILVVSLAFIELAGMLVSVFLESHLIYYSSCSLLLPWPCFLTGLGGRWPYSLWLLNRLGGKTQRLKSEGQVICREQFECLPLVRKHGIWM